MNLIFGIVVSLVITSVVVGAAFIFVNIPQFIAELINYDDTNFISLVLVMLTWTLFRIIEAVKDTKRNQKPKLRRIK